MILFSQSLGLNPLVSWPESELSCEVTWCQGHLCGCLDKLFCATKGPLPSGALCQFLCICVTKVSPFNLASLKLAV